jgi:hypothetical protein
MSQYISADPRSRDICERWGGTVRPPQIGHDALLNDESTCGEGVCIDGRRGV